jgi:hypothetical protein
MTSDDKEINRSSGQQRASLSYVFLCKQMDVPEGTAA